MDSAVCIGMPRAASRMTWQILKMLQGNDSRGSHGYISSDATVIYSYRHPVEAFLSLCSRHMQDVGKRVNADLLRDMEITENNTSKATTEVTREHAFYASILSIIPHRNIYKQLLEDSDSGRPVLFLRYEDFYKDEERRVLAIQKFLKRDISESKLKKICENVSLTKNAERGQEVIRKNPDALFAGNFYEEGIQRGHVNMQTMGRPGSHIKLNQEFIKIVLENQEKFYVHLRKMCQEMNYHLQVL